MHTVRTRLARFLSALAEGAPPRKRWTQEEIAASIGTVRETVGRTLRGFDGELGRTAQSRRSGRRLVEGFVVSSAERMAFSRTRRPWTYSGCLGG